MTQALHGINDETRQANTPWNSNAFYPQELELIERDNTLSSA
jgi:hypothetical protein